MIEIFKRQLSGRSPIWDYYFSVMPGHWWVGFGLGTPFECHGSEGKTVSPHAHRLYLQQIYDRGCIALIFKTVDVLSLVFKAWQSSGFLLG